MCDDTINCRCGTAVCEYCQGNGLDPEDLSEIDLAIIDALPAAFQRTYSAGDLADAAVMAG